MSEKEDYRLQIEAKVKAWKAEIERLQAKAELARADARVKLNQQIYDLEARWSKAKSTEVRPVWARHACECACADQAFRCMGSLPLRRACSKGISDDPINRRTERRHSES